MLQVIGLVVCLYCFVRLLTLPFFVPPREDDGSPAWVSQNAQRVLVGVASTLGAAGVLVFAYLLLKAGADMQQQFNAVR